MTPYHLAKIVEWAGTLETRKRMQKVVYLLQVAGCDVLDAEFTLHNYGPYSAEVASLADQISASGILEEQEQSTAVGTSFSYSLTENAKAQIERFERTERGKVMAADFVQFETKARKLFGANLAELEYGATTAYFYRQEKDWTKAQAKMCQFKKLRDNHPAARSALELAQMIVDESD